MMMHLCPIALALVALLISPLSGSIAASSSNISESPTNFNGSQIIEPGHSAAVPPQADIWWDSQVEWWEVSSLDEDRNGIHDSIQSATGPVNIGLSFSREVSDEDRQALESMSFDIHLELPIVDAILLGDVDASRVGGLSELDGVVMVERYGSLVLSTDVQTPAVPATNY